MKNITLSQLFNATTIYKIVFGTPPFPFWVLIQILWSVYIVQHSYHNKARSKSQILYELAVSFTMTFVTKEVIAICFDKSSPILSHPLSIVIFLLIFSIFEYFNLSSKLHKSGLDFAIGFLQSLNQMKLFTLILRTVHVFDGVSLLFVALIFASFDQIIEFVFRFSSKGNETGGSNWKTLFSMYALFSIYWFCVHVFETRVIPTALITSYFYGLICGISLIFSTIPHQKRKKNI